MIAWGVLSTARINRRAILEAVEQLAGAEVLAVASRDGERAGAYAREHRIPRHYSSYEALLADPDVQVVYISLPNALHVPWSRRALEAGKHVLCEKPLSRDPAEVSELFDLAESRGLWLSEAFMYRHHPQTLRIEQLVREGAIGELRLIRASFSFPCPADDPRMRLADGGGALMDLGCYPVSMARLLAGEPLRVAAEQRLGGDGVDAVMAAVMRFEGGVLAQIDCGLELPARRGLEVVGSSGVLRVAEPWQPVPDGIELWRDGAGEPELVRVPAASSYALQAADLSAAARGEHEPRLGRADALGQARAIAAIYQSAQAGGPVAV